MGNTKWSQPAFKRVTGPVAGQTGAEESQQRPPDVNKPPAGRVKAQSCSSLEHVYRNPPFRLPKRLVGTKSTARVTIKDEAVNCLLDTGSQVTTIPQLFYTQHLSEQEIKPLFNLLEVEGAAGQSVPYLGYVELAVTFPKELVGASVDVNTLALVIPDFEAATEPLVLIGTNTLDVLYDIYSKTGMTHQPTPHGYRA